MISIIFQRLHDSLADIIYIVICAQSQVLQKLNRIAVDFRVLNAKHHITFDPPPPPVYIP